MAKVFVGIGSNIDREQHIASGVIKLQQRFAKLNCSAVYESEPVGFNGPRFYNLVASFETELSVEQILAELKQIELENGRLPGAKKFASRTLDIDILLYDQHSCVNPCVIPRPEIIEHAFVLRPLAELVPDLKHPLLQQTYRELWAQFDQASQPLQQAAFSPLN